MLKRKLRKYLNKYISAFINIYLKVKGFNFSKRGLLNTLVYFQTPNETFFKCIFSFKWTFLHRWANAKGPLAVEFSSSEVKSLIRALFQNTERRAVALSKIK